MEDNELMFKYLANEFSDSENQEFEEKLKQDHALAAELSKVSNLWKSSPLFEDEIEVDEEKNWTSIKDKLGWTSDEEIEDAKVIKLQTSKPMWVKIAAAVVVTIGIAFSYFSDFSGALTADSAEVLTVSGNQGGKGLKNVTLSDGSVVVLNEGAELVYQEDFSNILERRVQLKGEAFFDISRDERKPFIISTEEGTDITVLGTSFNVRSFKETTGVSVVTGKVRVENLNVKHKVVVVKGQQAIYADNQLIAEDEFDRNSLAWKTGVLEFKASALPYVVDKLNEYYGVEIKVEGAKFNACSITTKIDNQSLEEALEMLSTILSAELEEVNNVINIKGDGC